MNLVQRKINDTLRLFRHPHHIGCIRLHSSTSQEHRSKIAEICLEAINQGNSFLTEAITLDGKNRADIVILDLGIAVEVTHSEGDDSIVRKAETCPLRVVQIPATGEFNWKMLL